MATVLLPVSEDHLTCPICCEVFKEPVVLKCSHSLCEECLKAYWSSRETLQCPVCRKVCSSEEPMRSLAFRNLCENFRSRVCVTPADDICTEHDEKLKLFCFEDKQPICVVCYTSKKHKNHRCAPIVEAVEDLKAEMKSGVSGLQNNLEILYKCKADYEILAETIQDDRQRVEKTLRQEFEILHQFLMEEEEARVKKLREEEMQKCEKTKNRIEKLSDEISDLSVTIKMITQSMEMDEITFLQKYANNQHNPAKYILPEPDMISGIDTAKHLALLNLNLKAKICELLHSSPKSVTFDPQTACNKLIVSEDLCSVSYVEVKQDVPDNPERLYVGVMGSQSFSSGLHRWDVEVGDNDHWTIGVINESVERKKLLKMDPSSGLWSIRFINGKYRAGVKSRKELSLLEKPRVIRVQLDYDNGTVTFFEPATDSVLYTFTDTFTESLLPYVNTASALCPLYIT